jgi:predicted Ser/Thr protein kinase
MESSTNSQVPHAIGPFRVVRLLGQGAMGNVYLGERTEGFAQKVAIKVLHPYVSLLLGQQPQKHEEAILTSLDHPVIVRLLDTSDSSGLQCIIMEYVEGKPLDVYCRDAATAKEQRVILLVKIARALDYAHSRLVIHSDLKPENIFVTADGQPKLLDFGVAELIGAQHLETQRTSFFTPDFASPEQLAGDRATAATDIYSFGKVGKLLLSKYEDRDLKSIFNKATEVAPADRYASAHALVADLQAYLEHRPVAARDPQPLYRASRWVRRHWLAATVALAVAFVLTASATGVFVQTLRAARERTRAQKQLADVVKLNGALAGELYDSAKSLPQAKQARATLLQTATDTLDTLSATKGQDVALAFEIAQQYSQLAKLEREEDNGQRGLAASQRDLEKARVLRDSANSK